MSDEKYEILSKSLMVFLSVFVIICLIFRIIDLEIDVARNSALSFLVAGFYYTTTHIVNYFRKVK